LGGSGVTAPFPFLKAPSGAARVVGRFLVLSVMVLGDGSFAVMSQWALVWWWLLLFVCRSSYCTFVH
jgi:hypothetical protein